MRVTNPARVATHSKNADSGSNLIHEFTQHLFILASCGTHALDTVGYVPEFFVHSSHGTGEDYM